VTLVRLECPDLTFAGVRRDESDGRRREPEPSSRPKPQNQTTAQREPRHDFHPARMGRRPVTRSAGFGVGGGVSGMAEVVVVALATLGAHERVVVGPLPATGSSNGSKPGPKTTRWLVRVRKRRPPGHQTSPHPTSPPDSSATAGPAARQHSRPPPPSQAKKPGPQRNESRNARFPPSRAGQRLTTPLLIQYLDRANRAKFDYRFLIDNGVTHDHGQSRNPLRINALSLRHARGRPI